MSTTEASAEPSAVVFVSGQGEARIERAPVAPSAALDESDRNPVFTSLVQDDSDVVGLVAYSIYKQNKHDWLMAFVKAKGRDPQDLELGAYILGESTPRRLATYRHLAQATLEGKGPDVHVGTSSGARTAYATPRRGSSVGSSAIVRLAGYVITAIVVFIAVLLAIHFGLALTPK